MSREVTVTGAFDDIKSREVRFLEESSKLGKVTVLLWDDESVRRLTGKPIHFPLAERSYVLGALRYVSKVVAVSQPSADALVISNSSTPRRWVDLSTAASQERQAFCRRHGIDYCALEPAALAGFPHPEPATCSDRKKVIVTGCYDWFHSGHVRFFEEVSAYGDLYVIVGHDANIRLLKGAGHPLLPQEERRYMVGSVRYVSQALISSGDGWLDAEPEIDRLKPDIYAVNEDGDRGGKREFCERRGIEYLVLQRAPAPGLPKRSSTELRGF